MQNPPQMEIFLGKLYYGLNMAILVSFFSPLAYGEFQRFFSKINLLYNM